jgi:hypothetical protein
MTGWKLAVLLVFGMLAGCSPFSDMQTGRVLDKGETEVTPYYSSTRLSSGGSSAKLQSGYGVTAGIGLAEQRKVDLRFRYELLSFENADDNVHVVGLGPKFRMGADNAAFYLPVGFGFGADEVIETSESWEIQPTLLATESSFGWLETTAAVKGLFRFADEPDPRFAFNLGLSIGPNPHRLAVRPEAGVMFSPQLSGFNYHLSIGLAIGFGEPRSPPADDSRVGGFAINDLEFNASYREIQVTGEIVNRTGFDQNRVRFEVLCTDPLGTVLASTQFEVADLEDGVPRRFEVRASGSELDRVSRCQVRPVEQGPPDS